MNPVTEVKTNPSPAVITKTTAWKLTPSTSPSFSFPVGYHDLHPDISINFQLNRFYNWVGDDSMLTEMRETLGGVKDATDYPMFTRLVLDLGEKALARHEVLKGAYYLRLAEFFMLRCLLVKSIASAQKRSGSVERPVADSRSMTFRSDSSHLRAQSVARKTSPTSF